MGTVVTAVAADWSGRSDWSADNRQDWSTGDRYGRLDVCSRVRSVFRPGRQLRSVQEGQRQRQRRLQQPLRHVLNDR